MSMTPQKSTPRLETKIDFPDLPEQLQSPGVKQWYYELRQAVMNSVNSLVAQIESLKNERNQP